MWQILIFEVISAAENSKKFPQKNQVLEEKSVEEVVTLGPNRHRPH
jgi:hypothetical protein